MENIQQFKKIRLFGSAAMSLVYVANGAVDAYKENSIWIWDVAAGAAIVSASGGSVSMIKDEGNKLKVKFAAANSNELVEELNKI